MSEDKRLVLSVRNSLQCWSSYLKLRKLVGPYITSGCQIVYKGSRPLAVSWKHLDHLNLVYICYFRCERNVLNHILLGDLLQSYLDIEILDYSLKVSRLGTKALQIFSGDRCCNSQQLKSGPD